jgi:hypothetical protein
MVGRRFKFFYFVRIENEADTVARPFNAIYRAPNVHISVEILLNTSE